MVRRNTCNACLQMEQFVQQQQIAIVVRATSPPPPLLFFISQSTLIDVIHQSASAGGLSPAAVPDESPEEQRDFASLLEQVSAFTAQHPPPSVLPASSTSLSFLPTPHISFAFTAQKRTLATRRVRGQVHHLYSVCLLHRHRVLRLAPVRLFMLGRYLNTVEELRSQALALWETVRQQGVFPASVLAGLQRCIGFH